MNYLDCFFYIFCILFLGFDLYAWNINRGRDHGSARKLWSFNLKNDDIINAEIIKSSKFGEFIFY